MIIQSVFSLAKRLTAIFGNQWKQIRVPNLQSLAAVNELKTIIFVLNYLTVLVI